MMRIDLAPLYEDQAGLDARIHAEHHVDYSVTRKKRLLALIVELGELANETRAFKFWSRKGPSAKAVILDEYADGLHFLLSLGIDLKNEKKLITLRQSKLPLTEQFLKVYSLSTDLAAHYDLKHYLASLQAFLNLIPALGLTTAEVVDGYHAKLAVNYQRQNTQY